LLGVGSRALRTVPPDPDGRLDMTSLVQAVAEDRRAGLQPFCVIGTAGSVDAGDFDDLQALAEFCAAERLWFHIDGAFGAWARLADAPWRGLTAGIDRADSIAFDFHKWMYVQYDCGAVLLRDESAHRAAFAARPAYLAAQDGGLGGGDPWYCDYGIDLSRGFRALKVWAALRAHGSAAFGAAITRNCQHAALMARLVESTPGLRLAAPVRLNVCCFSAAPADWPAVAQDDLNAHIARALQLSGDAVFSTTRIQGRTVLRAAIVNHRTCEADLMHAIEAVSRERIVALGCGMAPG
jgi:glutamate/tyrosine decarboxylase-like PLP-dependent enzyme